MSDDVSIEFGENNSENAVLLLGAAASLGLDASAVRTGQGKFIVSEEVAAEAGLLGDDQKPAKKAAKKTAKKAPAKKAPAKKSPAKKTTAATKASAEASTTSNKSQE